MSIDKIRYTARILLLLYIGYFGCVSYFIHSHIYQGVEYIHSHPYKKTNPEKNNPLETPLQTHQHTVTGFSTLNQVSNTTSFEAGKALCIERVDHLINTQCINTSVDITQSQKVVIFRHRAPPVILA